MGIKASSFGSSGEQKRPQSGEEGEQGSEDSPCPSRGFQESLAEPRVRGLPWVLVGLAQAGVGGPGPRGGGA